VVKDRLSSVRDLMLGASAAALACALVSGAAFAQQPATPAPAPAASPADPAAAAAAAEAEAAAGEEEVVVTGFRRSLSAAIDVKRNAAGSVDAILAEDIAKFPDNNLAESIQRIPGVSITRDAGEGRQISVRGLNSDFTRIRINGMEAISTTGGTDSSGGTNRSRGFDFNVFASELFSSITVRKTASGDVDEGSLGATVDLRAARPFDYDEGTTLAASAQANYNSLSESTDPRLAFLISQKSADGKLGFLFSAAYQHRYALEEGHSTVRWQNGNMACAPGVVGCVESQIDTAFTPRLPRYGILEHEQDRFGATAAFQYRPSEATLINVDLMYAKFAATRFEHFLEAPDFSATGTGGRPGIQVREYQIDARNNMVYGLFNRVDIRSESRFDDLSTTFKQATFSLEHEFNARLHFDMLAGYSRSDHDNPVQTTLLFDRTDVNGYSYDYRPDSNLPVIAYNFDVTAPASWRLSQIRLRPQTAANTYSTFNANLTWDVSDDVTLRGGFGFKRFEFKTSELRRSNGTTANLEATIPASVAATPLGSYSRLVSLADQWDIPAGNTLTWLIPDVHTAETLFGLNDPAIFRLGPEPALGNNRSVTEEDTGGYLQADFNTPFAGGTLRGNIGVRYVATNQTSFGYQLTSGTPVQVRVDRTYTDTLPSLNLAWDATEDLVIRASVAKVMSRPGLNGLTPGGSVSVSGNNRTVTSGNPFLDPTRATNYDLAVEWYFAPESVLSAAFFYKEIDSFVANQSITRPFTGNPLGLPDSLATAACGTIPGCSAASDWAFNAPINTQGGSLKGFELSYQQPFSFLPEGWDNFGAILNYTYVESEILYPDATQPSGFVSAPLTGLSKTAWNATLYYEDDVISARVSASYRDGYLTRVPGQNGNSVEGTNETLNVDASFSYQVNDQFAVSLEALNLTDEVNDQYVDASDRVVVYHHTGQQFLLGVRYTY
jgi:TonB-dependent receptor